MNSRVQKVLALMHTDCRRTISLTRMAQLAQITPTHFCRLFKAETGLAPAHYLKRLRMEKAGQLLASPFLQVKEVAACVGVTDISSGSGRPY